MQTRIMTTSKCNIRLKSWYLKLNHNLNHEQEDHFPQNTISNVHLLQNLPHCTQYSTLYGPKLWIAKTKIIIWMKNHKSRVLERVFLIKLTVGVNMLSICSIILSWINRETPKWSTILVIYMKYMNSIKNIVKNCKNKIRGLKIPDHIIASFVIKKQGFSSWS